MEQPFAIGYTGSHVDTGTRYCVLGNGYRWYNPALMRFMSSDDWSPFGPGGINPYVYCMDDPINASDPSGHAPWGWLGKMTRRLRAALPDGSIDAENSALHSKSSSSTLAKFFGHHRPERSGSMRSDRVPIVAAYREEEAAREALENYLAVDEQAEQAWAERMRRVPAQAAAAAQAAELCDTAKAAAHAEWQRRLDFVFDATQSTLSEIEQSRPRLERSHSLYSRYPNTGLDAVGPQRLWHEHFVFLIRRMNDRHASWISDEIRAAMPGRIRGDMEDTLKAMMRDRPQPQRMGMQAAFDITSPN
ncbi:RHS repeat-associated core domain-containing protein [Trinickia sp. NRRL B-1857]|uniref:RHS repeat-associated core domain-containing protein n=1 Tax=Trinickia sp. NRRL B-1857 TaxID=3162879 RepID=UPI003D2CE95C